MMTELEGIANAGETQDIIQKKLSEENIIEEG